MATYVFQGVFQSWAGATASATTWRTWTTTANTTASSATASQPWQYWVSTDATTTPAAAWQVWADHTGIIAPASPLTQEQLDAARVARAAQEEALARSRADRAEAVQRAETLLHEHLTIRQRRSLKAHNRFRVKAQSGRWYEIERGHHANTFALDAKGKRTERLCVYATGGVPEADCMLAQKLHLEADEERLRQVAHITRP